MVFVFVVEYGLLQIFLSIKDVSHISLSIEDSIVDVINVRYSGYVLRDYNMTCIADKCYCQLLLMGSLALMKLNQCHSQLFSTFF